MRCGANRVLCVSGWQLQSFFRLPLAADPLLWTDRHSKGGMHARQFFAQCWRPCKARHDCVAAEVLPRILARTEHF